MRTKPVDSHHFTVEDVHRIRSRPLEMVLDDAVAYWLEDVSGHQLSPEASRSLGPLFRALDLAAAGHDPDDMILCARLDTGERFELGGGLSLVGVAEAAAGIPARPRQSRSTDGH